VVGWVVVLGGYGFQTRVFELIFSDLWGLSRFIQRLGVISASPSPY
jgi:hypothetical protein